MPHLHSCLPALVAARAQPRALIRIAVLLTALLAPPVMAAAVLGSAQSFAALADATLAYTALASLAPTNVLSDQDLGSLGHALTPGVYRFASDAALNGTLVLDFLTHPQGRFVFQITSALTTGTEAAIQVLNACAQSGVYWLVGSSATLGTGTDFVGNVLAHASITLDPGAQLLGGRALALGAAPSH